MCITVGPFLPLPCFRVGGVEKDDDERNEQQGAGEGRDTRSGVILGTLLIPAKKHKSKEMSDLSFELYCANGMVKSVLIRRTRLYNF